MTDRVEPEHTIRYRPYFPTKLLALPQLSFSKKPPLGGKPECTSTEAHAMYAPINVANCLMM